MPGLHKLGFLLFMITICLFAILWITILTKNFSHNLSHLGTSFDNTCSTVIFSWWNFFINSSFSFHIIQIWYRITCLYFFLRNNGQCRNIFDLVNKMLKCLNRTQKYSIEWIYAFCQFRQVFILIFDILQNLLIFQDHLFQ